MTAEQWRLLKSGAPDDATQTMLADLLSNIITILSSAFMTALNISTVISEQHVRSSLGDILPQTFADVLDVTEIQFGSFGLLMDLVCKEVTEIVNSALTSDSGDSSSSELPNYKHIAPPSRVSAIVSHACRRLKALMIKLKKTCFEENKEHVKLEDLADFEDRRQCPL